MGQNTRNFSEDLTAVLAMYYPGKDRNIKFPLRITDEFKEENILEAIFSKRASNIILRNGVETVEKLIDNFDNLSSFRGCGSGTVKEIRNTFLKYYYSTLNEKQIKTFWKEFIEVNGFAYANP